MNEIPDTCISAPDSNHFCTTTNVSCTNDAFNVMKPRKLRGLSHDVSTSTSMVIPFVLRSER